MSLYEKIEKILDDADRAAIEAQKTDGLTTPSQARCYVYQSGLHALSHEARRSAKMNMVDKPQGKQ